MDEMVGMMREGGATMYLVLLLLLVWPFVVLIAGVVAALRVRIPALGWLAMAVLTLAGGILGRVMGLVQVRDAVGWASLDMRDTLTCSGLAIAPHPEIFALLGCAAFLALTALVAGIAALIGAGKQARWTPAPGGIATALGGLGWLGITGWAVVTHAGGVVLAIPAALLVGGLGITSAGLRMADDERDAQRTAASRGLAAACTGLAVGCLLVAGRMMGMADVRQSVASEAAEFQASSIAFGLTLQSHATTIGLAALGLVLVAGAIPALAAARAFFRPYTLVSGAATLLVLGLLGGLHFLGHYQDRSLEGGLSLIQSARLAADVADLPEPGVHAVEPRVYQLDRTLTWDGSTWADASYAGDAGEPYERPSMEYAGDDQPLIVAPSATPAVTLVQDHGWTQGRDVTPSVVRVLTRRPSVDDRLQSPYLDWTRLGAVSFLWLPGRATGGPPALDDANGALGIGGIGALGADTTSGTIEDPQPAPRKTGKASLQDRSNGPVGEEVADIAGILAILGEQPLDDVFATAPLSDWPPIEESVFVLDGGNAPGAGDLGIPAGSPSIWVVATDAMPREIAAGDAAADQLLDALEVLGRPFVVFLPADTWTMQDLVTLCLHVGEERAYAPAAFTFTESSYATTSVSRSCAVDRALPYPASGPRIQGLP